MSRSTRHRTGYATAWAWSYILPVAGGLVLWLPTRSAPAAIAGTAAGFVLFAVLAARRR